MGGFVQRIEGFSLLALATQPSSRPLQGSRGLPGQAGDLSKSLHLPGPQFTLLKNGYVGDNYCLGFL